MDYSVLIVSAEPVRKCCGRDRVVQTERGNGIVLVNLVYRESDTIR